MPTLSPELIEVCIRQTTESLEDARAKLVEAEDRGFASVVVFQTGRIERLVSRLNSLYDLASDYGVAV